MNFFKKFKKKTFKNVEIFKMLKNLEENEVKKKTVFIEEPSILSRLHLLHTNKDIIFTYYIHITFTYFGFQSILTNTHTFAQFLAL